MDDASRFIAGFGVFGHATGRNAIAVLHEAISNHGSPASILTDHGSQFYANAGEYKQKDASEFEDTYHRRNIVESVFSSFKCRFTASCSCKEDGNAKTTVNPQVHLLQPVVIVERRQKIRVMCLAYAVQPCNVLAQDTPRQILSRENSATYRKSKTIKCR